jgi:hypothetical protein
MDPRERIQDPEEPFRRAADALQAGLWTAIPGIIVSFSGGTQTAVVQPAVQQAVLTEGRTRPITVLQDVPVYFPAGGGVTLTFPVAAGDECLLVFAARSIDGWWQSGGVQPAGSARMHSLSDAFAFVGIRSRPRALPGFAGAAAELRTDDGTTTIRLAPGQVTVIAPTKVLLDTPLVEVSGDVVAGGISLRHHVHGATSEGTTTSEPLP